MNITLFLAQALGIYFLIVGFAFAGKEARVRTLIRKMLEDDAVLFLSGFVALILGILMVVSHNVWVMDWRVIITIIGWMALIKGFVIITFPEVTIRMSELWLRYNVVYLISWIALLGLGFFLGYHGFF